MIIVMIFNLNLRLTLWQGNPFTSSYSTCGSILLLVNYEVYSATFLVFLPECKQTFSDFIGIFPSADVQSASGCPHESLCKSIGEKSCIIVKYCWWRLRCLWCQLRIKWFQKLFINTTKSTLKTFLDPAAFLLLLVVPGKPFFTKVRHWDYSSAWC